MCNPLGAKHRRGRFCCCSSSVGQHFTGLVSTGLLVLYFILLIRSAEANEFNWMTIVWLVLIGLPRVIFWIVSCNDSIVHRRNLAYAMVGSTCIEFIIFVANQFIIFIHDEEYCNRVYVVIYMMEDWDISCDWAITIYEIFTTLQMTYYFYAAAGAIDHYYVGFKHPRLEMKEIERLKK